MSLITALHAIVSQLPVRDNNRHGGDARADRLSITEPRSGHSLQSRVFLRATSGPTVAAAVDWDGRLILHDSEDTTAWIRAEMDSYLMAEEFQ